MNRLLVVVLSAVVGILVVNPLTALAQQPSTVGDLMDKGAKKLTKEELRTLCIGATVSGVQTGTTGITFQNKLMPDGSVAGNAWSNGVWTTAISGTWSVSANGQICFDLLNSSRNPIKNCSYYFTFGNRFYAAATDGRSETVYERQFTK